MTVAKSAMDYRDLRVFVSSRMAELAEERRAIKAALQEAGVNAWVFEAPDGAGAQPRSIQRTYLDELEQADLYVGIFWRGYGEYTEDEYRHAVSAKPCLVYEKYVDIGARDQRLQALLDEMSAVKEGLTIQRFTTSGELAEFAPRDVRRLLTAIFRDRAASAATPMQAPAPRAEFVPRPQVTKVIKAALLAPRADDDTALRVLAVVGMGGSGKSMLATAVAQDPEVRAAFRDGILWTMLGQTPNVGAVLESWIRALGNKAFRFTTEAVALAELNTLVSQRRVLLVIDDASDPAHVEPLLVGSATSAVLITTREQIVAQAAGATDDRVIEVGGVTREEALAILGGGPGPHTMTPPDTELAAKVADAVGYLPLALSLAARQAADGVTWADLVADLTSEITRLESLEVAGAARVIDPEVRKRLSLRASLNVSLNGLTAEQRERFEALGVLRKGAVITPAIAATVWNVESRTARDDLRYLRAKALLLVSGPAGRGMTLTYALHDVVRDLAWQLSVERHGGQPANAHGMFIERIRARLMDGLWHTAPDDGYARENLVFHLERADRADLVHVLLTERSADGTNAWLAARSGHLESYLTDVRRGLQLALEGRSGDATPIGLPQAAFYLLMLTTYASFSPPPALARELVSKDRLGLRAARAYALATHDLPRRVRSLTLLSDTTTGAARDGLLDDALAAAQALPDDDSETRGFLAVKLAAAGRAREALALAVEIDGNQERAVALGGMIPHLNAEDRALAIQRGIESARSTGMLFAPAAVEALVDHLDEPPLRELIAEAQSMRSSTWRDDTLTVLVPRLLDLGHGDEAQALVGKFASDANVAAALAKMVPNLVEPQRTAAIRTALDAVRDVDDESWRKARSAALRDIFDDPSMIALMDVVFAEKSCRADTLTELAPYLPADMCAEALAMSEASSDLLFRVTGVAAVLPSLDPATRRTAATAARDRVKAIEGATDQVEALIALLKQADPAQIADLTTGLFDAIDSIDFLYERSQRLARAATAIPADTLGRALDIVEGLAPDDRVAPVEALASRLDGPGLDRAFSLCRAIQDGDAIREARIAALARLGDDDRLAALSIVGGMDNPYEQAAAVAKLAATLPGHALGGALDLLRALRDDRGNPVVDVALPALARRASGDMRTQLIRELLAGIAAMSDGERAAWKVGEASDLLSSSDYEELLDAAPAIAGRSSADLQLFERLVLEVELLRGLSEPARSRTFDDVLRNVPELEEAYEQRNMLVAAARHAPDIAFPGVVNGAILIPDPLMRAMALALLLPHAPTDDERRSIAGHIGEVRELGGPLSSDQRRLAELTLALMLEQLPVGAPLDMIADFEDEDARSIGLVAVAPRLGDGDRERALEIVKGIESRGARCKGLLALARVMPERAAALVEEALARTLTTQPDSIDGELLETVVSCVVELSPASLAAAWTAAANQLASCPRPALVGQLVHLVPMLERGGGDVMLRWTATALGDVAHWFP